jgi:predicted nucleotidyltransferase
MTHVEMRQGLTVDDDIIGAFAVRNGIIRLALFGSALRDDLGPQSDIDLLVEFASDRVPGLLHLAQMELELDSILGRRVDLRTYEDLSHHFRDDVSANARPLYAA